MHYQSLDKKGKSMFIEPWLYPKMPFTLLAYELLRKDWIFSRSLLRLRSFELIFIPMVSLESFLTCKMIFILVNLATGRSGAVVAVVLSHHLGTIATHLFLSQIQAKILHEFYGQVFPSFCKTKDDTSDSYKNAYNI